MAYANGFDIRDLEHTILPMFSFATIQRGLCRAGNLIAGI
jgi:hypothetical protein